MKEKIDAPEGSLCIGGALIHANTAKKIGWGMNDNFEGSVFDYKQDVIIHGMKIYYMPEREERVRKWIAKNRLMNPNFVFNVVGPWSEGVKHGKD